MSFAETSSPWLDPLAVLQQGGVAAAFVVMWWLERRTAAKERTFRDELTARALALNQINGELIKLIERHTESATRLTEHTARIYDLLAALRSEAHQANRPLDQSNAR